MLRRRILEAAFAIAVAAIASTAAFADAARDGVVGAVTRGDYAAAAEGLARLEAEDAARFRANNYDYLLGRVLEQRGDYAGATARYMDVVKRGSNLAEYALWHLAAVARLEGAAALERQYLTQLTSRYPSSALYAAAGDRLARSAFQSGDYRTALARWAPLAGTKGANARATLARVALARLRLGDPQARRDFASLLDGTQDDSALAAARGLDELDEKEKVSLSEAERLRRGRLYLFERDWLGARKHFLALADTPGSANRAEALFSVGNTYYRLNEFDTAIDWWEKAAREFPDAATGIKAFYSVGHAHQRAGRFDKAAARYEEFIGRYPSDEQVEGAYRNAIDSWRMAGNTAQALVWCDRAESAQPRSALATFAAFNRAKTRLAANDNTAALGELLRLEQSYNLQTPGAGMPSPGEIRLLKGVCLERLGRIPEAAALYLSMPATRSNYFGNRATLRLIALGARPEGKAEIDRLLGEALGAARDANRAGDAAAAKAAADRGLRLTIDPAVRRELLGILRSSYAALPAYARAPYQPVVPVARPEISAGQPGSGDRSHAALGAELAFLGLYDEASPELKASGLGTRSPYSMVVYDVRGSHAEGSIRMGESLVARLPDDFRVELLPRDVAEMLYPAPYRGALRRFALPLGLDPRFELSIARQESTFRPWVKSPAAARGLVQFIPETANKIAAALGVAPFDQDDLYDPEVAVRFGAKYMTDLFGLFPDNPYAVAASYNGGEDNVERWLKRAASREDPELFTVEVGFKESKDYVYRVMNNYWAYQSLYSRELNPNQ